MHTFKYVSTHQYKHSQSVTGVSRGGLDDRVARFEDAVSLGVLHHPQADPVLDTAAGIEELTLGHYEHATETCVSLHK